MADLRSVKARKTYVLGVLEAQGDLWLATADLSARPHLIAVSAWWDGTDIVVATTARSRTAAKDAGEVADGFAIAVGWDPREVGSGWKFFRLRPTRIQAYRGYDELEGRNVMTNSRWLA